MSYPFNETLARATARALHHPCLPSPLPSCSDPPTVSSMFKHQISQVSRPSIFKVPRELKTLHSFCASKTHTTSQPCFPGPQQLSLRNLLSLSQSQALCLRESPNQSERQAQSLTQTVRVQYGRQISLQTHLGAPEHMALELNPAEEKGHLTFHSSQYCWTVQWFKKTLAGGASGNAVKEWTAWDGTHT